MAAILARLESRADFPRETARCLPPAHAPTRSFPPATDNHVRPLRPILRSHVREKRVGKEKCARCDRTQADCQGALRPKVPKPTRAADNRPFPATVKPLIITLLPDPPHSRAMLNYIPCKNCITVKPNFAISPRRSSLLHSGSATQQGFLKSPAIFLPVCTAGTRHAP